MRVLSGAQAGVKAFAPPEVSAWRPDPSGRMSQTSRTGVPGARRTYAIHVPSGDHAGSDSSAPGAEIRRAAEPSEPITKMSRSRSNAIYLPSGDHVGGESFSFV